MWGRPVYGARCTQLPAAAPRCSNHSWRPEREAPRWAAGPSKAPPSSRNAAGSGRGRPGRRRCPCTPSQPRRAPWSLQAAHSTLLELRCPIEKQTARPSLPSSSCPQCTLQCPSLPEQHGPLPAPQPPQSTPPGRPAGPRPRSAASLPTDQRPERRVLQPPAPPPQPPRPAAFHPRGLTSRHGSPAGFESGRLAVGWLGAAPAEGPAEEDTRSGGVAGAVGRGALLNPS